MTPDKSDIDFKLVGAKWEFIYLESGNSNHNHILGSTYCSANPQSLYKGKGFGGSANLNQCLLVDCATSLQFFFILQISPRFSPL